MKEVRIVLCVPDCSANRLVWVRKAATFSKEVEADLVVFPEAFEYCRKPEDACIPAKKIAKEIGVAVLAGVSTDEGYEAAAFWNPAAKKGETRKHVYVKHSTAGKLAFEWPPYKGKNDPMFGPIALKGLKIGVMICHDMFFPLVVETFVRHGAEVLIDLTGGNVKLAKWTNIIQARSLEMRGVFLCTMGYDRRWCGESTCIGFENGRRMQVFVPQKGRIRESFDGPQPRGLAAVAIPPRKTAPRDHEQVFSGFAYSDITISLGRNQKADFNVRRAGNGIKVAHAGRSHVPDADGWIRIRKPKGIVGLLVLPLKSILDRTTLLRRIPTQRTDYHLVLYHATRLGRLLETDVLALAKLRAIENRVGVLVFAGDVREAIKTNKYKDIQRFDERKGLFGFDLRNLGGPDSAFSPPHRKYGIWQGIPEKFKDRYFSLL